MGQPVAELAYGAFSEWAIMPAKHALAVPVLAPEIVALLTSGLTASIGVPAHAEPQSVSTLHLHAYPCHMNIGMLIFTVQISLTPVSACITWWMIVQESGSQEVHGHPQHPSWAWREALSVRSSLAFTRNQTQPCLARRLPCFQCTHQGGLEAQLSTAMLPSQACRWPGACAAARPCW